MAWEVLYDPEFREWLLGQDRAVRVGINNALVSLKADGPQLGWPYVDTLKGSRIDNLKEMRVRVGRSPYRVLFAFDPIRRAFILVGGDKGKDKRWYKINIPIAEERFARHLARIAQETEQDG